MVRGEGEDGGGIGTRFRRRGASGRGTARRRLPRTALLPILLIAGLLALEGAGRLYMHARYGVPGKSYGRWRSDPVLGARMAESVYDHRWRTNGQGFRSDEELLDPKPQGALRILAYGGSTTLCWNLPTEETWPTRLQDRLRAATANPGHQVLNAGDILWSIGHVLARATEEIPRLRPDIVILYSGINEVSNALHLRAEGRDLSERVRRGEYGAFARNLPQNAWLARNSVAYRVVHKLAIAPLASWLRTGESARWDHLRTVAISPESPPVPPDPVVLENYLAVLDRIIELCRENGAEPLFVVQARGLDTVALEHFTAYSRAGAEVARSRGVTVVDAQEGVDARPGGPMELFRESGIHYSAEGADLLAARLCEAVLALARRNR